MISGMFIDCVDMCGDHKKPCSAAQCSVTSLLAVHLPVEWVTLAIMATVVPPEGLVRSRHCCTIPVIFPLQRISPPPLHHRPGSFFIDQPAQRSNFFFWLLCQLSLSYQFFPPSCLLSKAQFLLFSSSLPVCFLQPTHYPTLGLFHFLFSKVSDIKKYHLTFLLPCWFFLPPHFVFQEWVTATDLLISLDRLNTFGDEFFKDAKVLRSYFYAISDFSVGGR